MTRVFIVPHTHWDREWYEPAARFRQRLVALLDDAVAWLESEPDAGPVLLDGQTVLLADYLAVRPEAEEPVAALVRAGRLLVGPWFVLADELLPTDETLVRNLLIGRYDGARFGGWLSLGYSPDAFGHPAALPTVLTGFGIEHAIVWRGYGGEPGQERDLFRWVGPDGSAVLVHHLPPVGYEIGADLPLEPDALAGRWEEIRAVLEPRATAPALLVMNGADHHAIQRDVGAVTDRLAELAQGHHFELASPAAYFAALPEDLEVPEVRGELRFSYRYTWTLQSVHSTRSRLKRAIAEGGRLLQRWAEPQAALAWAAGATDRRALLGSAWRDHLLDCFHDALAGCTGDAVARQVSARAEGVAAQARGILVDAAHDRLEQDQARAPREPHEWEPALAVINPSAHPRDGVVEATLTVSRKRLVVGRPGGGPADEMSGWPAPPGVVEPDGSAVPVQVLEWYRGYQRLDSRAAHPVQDEVAAYRVALRCRAVPPLGMRAYAVGGDGPPAPADEHVWVSGRCVAAPWGEVAEDPGGGFVVRAREPGLELYGVASLVSERDEGDTYTFEPVSGDTPVAAQWGRTRAVWEGPLVAATAREFRLGDRVHGTVFARLDAGSRLVRFAVQGVNLRGSHRLRVVVPLPQGARAVTTVADMQYGPVRRRHRVHDRAAYPREWPADTAPVQRYVSVPHGFTVFARGLHEYELTPEGAIAVTLLRAVGDLSRGDLRARPGHAAWPAATPEAQELGSFRAEFALAPSAVDLESAPEQWAAVERLAEEFHAPLAGVMLPYAIDVPWLVEGPVLSGDGLVLTAVKQSEDGTALVLRCVNVTERPVPGSWTVPFEIERAWRARLDEKRVADLTPTGGERRIPFEAGPREVVTLLVEQLKLTDIAL